jgi:hypothetical protein
MRREFSENSNGLLRNSLTLEAPDFPHGIEGIAMLTNASTPHGNSMFTMNAPGRGRSGHSQCAP